MPITTQPKDRERPSETDAHALLLGREKRIKHPSKLPSSTEATLKAQSLFVSAVLIRRNV
jgi:hypothetical protein